MEIVPNEQPHVLPPLMRAIDTPILLLTKTVLVMIGVTFTVMISAEVGARFVLDYSISQVNAISQILLVWFFLLGAGLAMREGGHVGLDVLTSRVSGRPAFVLMVATNILVLLFFLLIMWGSFRAFRASLSQFDGTLGISMGWVMAAFPVSFALLIYHQFATVVEATIKARRKA